METRRESIQVLGLSPLKLCDLCTVIMFNLQAISILPNELVSQSLMDKLRNKVSVRDN